jgi:hypothetical protein
MAASTESLQQQFNEQEDTRIIALAQLLNISLDGFLHGTVYSKIPYTAYEIEQIQQDLVRIEELAFDRKISQQSPQYIATAGAPGTGKTWFLENGFISPSFIYVDPDAAALKELTGYRNDIEQHISLADAYNKWRDASNYVACHMLLKAMCRKLNILHGTTSSNPKVKDIYQGLKKLNYKITLHALFASAASRAGAINFRNETFVQVTLSDAKTKGKGVIERFVDCYFRYADEIHLYLQPDSFWQLASVPRTEIGIFHDSALDVLVKESNILFLFSQQLYADAVNPSLYDELRQGFLGKLLLPISALEVESSMPQRSLEENSLSAFITTLYNSSSMVAGSSGATTVDVSSGLVGDDRKRALPQVKF